MDSLKNLTGEKILIFGTLVYMVLQAWFPFLERGFFWGELLILFSLFFILKQEFSHPIQKQLIISIFAWCVLISLYALWITFNFWEEEYRFFYILRGLTLFYYAVFFFIAYKYCYRLIALGTRYWFLIMRSLPIRARYCPRRFFCSLVFPVFCAGCCLIKQNIKLTLLAIKRVYF